MNMELIKSFLIDECRYESIEEAIKNTPKVNFYAFVGEVDRTNIKKEKINKSEYK